MLFSIITINYNNAEGLRRTIDSVAGQDYADREYIVIDGGSTDGSRDIIAGKEESIDQWVSEADRGIYHAMNKGVARATGSYCLFMNSGDTMYDGSVLTRMSAVAEASGADIIIGRVVTKEGDEVSPPPERPLSLYHLYAGAIPHQGAFIRTELLRRRPYDETLRICSDWKFFIEAIVLDNCTVDYSRENVAVYDTTGISSGHPAAMREEKERVMAALLPPRIVADMEWMKRSECLTQTLTPRLRINYGIDRILYRLGRLLLKIREKKQ